MKKILYTLALISITGLFCVSCTKSETIPSLLVSKSEIVFSAQAQEEFEVLVATDQPNWSVVSDQAWCIVSPQYGKFVVSALPNLTIIDSPVATITVSANGAAPVKIKVTQNLAVAAPYVVMEHSDGHFGGDAYYNGLSFFYIDLYNGDYETMVGVEAIQITGFDILQPGSTYSLTPGTYELMVPMNTVSSTFIPGNRSTEGTFTYKRVDDQWVITALATGGQIEVTTEGDIYTITTNLTAKDPVTNVVLPNIKVKFSGPISFFDHTAPPVGDLNFDDIKASTYVATGVPQFLNPLGPTTWSGTVTPINDENGKRYYITNWAGMKDSEPFQTDYEYGVYCRFENGYLYLDSSPLDQFEDGSYTMFTALAINKNVDYISVMSEFVAQFDKVTKVIDFSAEDDWNYAAVGVAMFFPDGEVLQVTEFYKDLKLTLTETTRAGIPSTNIAAPAKFWPNLKTIKTAFTIKIPANPKRFIMR